MCLSTVYLVGGEGRKPLGEYISGVRVEDGKIILSDIMGAETKIEGVIQNIDLVKNIILIGPHNP
jgi:predicted RNA-binding protein